jgi:hypothetical protein
MFYTFCWNSILCIIMLFKYWFCLFYVAYFVFCWNSVWNQLHVSLIYCKECCLEFYTPFPVLLLMKHPQIGCKLCFTPLCRKHSVLFSYHILCYVSMQFLNCYYTSSNWLLDYLMKHLNCVIYVALNGGVTITNELEGMKRKQSWPC